MTLDDRFWSKVNKDGECWLWTATKNPDGYGQFWLDGKMRSAFPQPADEAFRLHLANEFLELLAGAS